VSLGLSELLFVPQFPLLCNEGVSLDQWAPQRRLGVNGEAERVGSPPLHLFPLDHSNFAFISSRFVALGSDFGRKKETQPLGWGEEPHSTRQVISDLPSGFSILCVKPLHTEDWLVDTAGVSR
jgi:hypothetical protein